MVIERPGFPVEYRDAEDVGRKQVAGELHPTKPKPQHLSERMRQGGFAETGEVLDEKVALGQEARQG